MQISSNYNTLFSTISQLYGNTSGKASQVSTLNSGSSSSSSTDQVDLSDDYLSFQSFLDKVKNGTVTDDDLSEMQDAMNTSGQMMMPPPPSIQTSGTGSSEESNAIGSFLDKVKNGTVTSDDLTNMASVLSKVSSSSSADAETVSSTDNDNQATFKSFLDKVKNGTVTDDDLTQMQSLLEEMDANRPSMPPMGMEFGDESDSTDSVSASGIGTVSSTSSSDSTNSLTLESFLDKVKNGTVTDDDLTQMQSLLEEMDANRPSMPPPPMGMMGFGDSSDSTGTSATSSSSSDSTDSLTLQSFLDKIKNGTVSSDDLTEMQSLLENWTGDSSESWGTNAQVYNL
jgi:hypothetical protein